MTPRGVRRLLVLFAALIVFAAIVAGVFLMRRGARADQLAAKRETGLRLAESGAYESGLEALSDYVAVHKDDPEAFLAFARCRAAVPMPNGKHLEIALHAARAARELSPQDPEPLRFLMEVYEGVGQQTELIEVAEAMLRVVPSDEQALSARVRALSALDREDAADEAAGAYIAAHPEKIDAYLARAGVMLARGAGLSEIEAYMRSGPVSEAMGGQAIYHLALVNASMQAGFADAAVREEAFARAVESVQTAAGIMPERAEVAAETASTLREIGSLFGIAGLTERADAYAESYYDQAKDPDRFAMLESIGAWWRADDSRAVGFAARIDPERCGVPEAGWRLAMSNATGDGRLACDGCVERISAASGDSASADMNAARYWGALAPVFGPGSGLALGEVIGSIDRAEQAIGTADLGLNRVMAADLVAFVRAQAFAAANQAESAIRALEQAPGGLEVRAQRARLHLLLADLCTTAGRMNRASDVLARLERLGVGGPLTDGVVSRFMNKRMSARGIGNAAEAAELQLSTISARASEDPSDAGVAAVHARLLLLAGRADDGLAEARRLLGLRAPADTGQLVALAEMLAPLDQGLAESVLTMPGVDRRAVGLLGARAVLMALGGRPDDGLALFENAGWSDREDIKAGALARARYMDRFGLGGAEAAAGRVSDSYPDDPAVQAGVLGINAAWRSEPVVRTAIARLRGATTEDAIEWRTQSARADIVFIDDVPETDRATVLNSAIISLRGIAREVPDDPALPPLIAEGYQKAGNIDEAIRTLENAAGGPNGARFYPDLITLLGEQGQRSEAERALDTFAALPQGSLSPDLLRRRASLLERLGRPAEAARDREQLAAGGGLSDRSALGHALARAGDQDGARRVAESILRERADLETASIASSILITAGLPGEGADVFLEAADTGTASELNQRRVELARVLIGHNAWDDAAAQLRVALESDRDGRAAVMLVLALLSSGAEDEARAVVAPGGPAPDTETVRALRGALAMSDGGLMARALATAAVSEREADTALSGLLTEHLLGRIDLPTLVGQLDTLASDPQDGERTGTPIVWRVLLMLQRRAIAQGGGAPSSESPVISLLERAASALPRELWPVRELANEHLNAGRLDEAASAARSLAERSGRDTYGADVIRARIAEARGRLDEAAAWLSPHTDRLASGRHTGAELSLLVRSLAGSGRAADAEAFIERRSAADAGSRWLLLDAASAVPGGELSRARGWLERLDEESRATPLPLARAWAQLAHRSGDAGDATRARDLLGLIPEQDQTPVMRTTLAEMAALRGDTDQAASIYESLLVSMPENPLVLNNFAHLLTSRLNDPGRAVGYAEKALRIGTESGMPPAAIAGLSHTLGAALRGAGRADEAEPVLRRGIAAGGASADLVIELAELLLDRGDPDGARAVFDRLPPIGTLTENQRARASTVRESLR